MVVWPTWVATSVPELVAACLRAAHRFGDTVLSVFVGPPAGTPVDDASIDELTREARLARSNAEAAIERMAVETPGRSKGSLSLAAAEGILAQVHRYGLAGLSLRVHMNDRANGDGIPELRAARQAISDSFDELASAVEAGDGARVRPLQALSPAPGRLPGAPVVQLVAEEVREMADAVDTSIRVFDDQLSSPAAGR
jgi:hypothetical protein